MANTFLFKLKTGHCNHSHQNWTQFPHSHLINKDPQPICDKYHQNLKLTRIILNA